MKLLLLILFTVSAAMAQTNVTAVAGPTPSREQRAADLRPALINGRHCVCGKVIKIVPEGLVVDSGYAALMAPPFNQSWVFPGGALVSRDPKLLERSEPASPCVGTVLLTDFPKRPAVKLYDYVVIQGYPAGEYRYVPVPGVEKSIRRFSGGLDSAVKFNLESGAK